MNDLIKCPYCDFTEDYCHFPDLIVTDCESNENLLKQYNIFLKIQKAGFNIVTCGMCGDIVLIER